MIHRICLTADASKNVAGALQGLARMGHRTVEVVVLPNVETLLKQLRPALEVCVITFTSGAISDVSTGPMLSCLLYVFQM
jgi:hypothetical protein